MGSGESDVRTVAVSNHVENNTMQPNRWYPGTTTGTNTATNSFSFYPYTNYSTTTIYKYQIKCPVRACKKMNWLELDKITPCTGCSVKLKAVSQVADYEISIE